MALLKKNGNRKLKNYFDYHNDTKATLKYKRGIISNMKIDAPLFSWPKDKLTLLSIINTYLAKYNLRKIDKDLDFVGAVQEATDVDIEMTEDSAEDVLEKMAKMSEDGSSENGDSKGETTEATEGESASETVQEESKEESEESQEELEPLPYIDESEYIDIPDQIHDIENCTAKMLGCIVRILNARSNVLRKIALMKKSRADVEDVNLEIEKVVVYNIALAKYLPILNNQDAVDLLTLKKATEIFQDVCVEGYEEIPTQKNIETEIKKNKEEQDFDIVSALAYCGVDVDRDDFGYYTVFDYSNGNGIKYYIGKQEKNFALSKNSCHKFIDQFLNKPIENRKFMTPGQVFITYIGEAEKSLGINTHTAMELNDLFGTMNQNKSAKAYFKDVIKKYSRNAQEWKDYQKLFRAEYYSNKESKDDISNRIHIKQQAKRLVIGEMFEDLLNEEQILNENQLRIGDYRISDISRDFGLDIDLNEIKVDRTRIERIEDYSFRIINIMHQAMHDMQAFMQDIIDNYTVDYLRKEKIFLLQQDDQKEFINKKKEFEDLIEKLTYDKAKDSTQQIAYYQQQIDDLTQKIGNQEYREAKDDLLKSKNNYRILLLNAKTQKELIKAEINKRQEKAESEHKKVTIEEKLEILKEILSSAPELIFTFDKGKATSWTKHRIGEKATKREESLSSVDKIIERTAARISDESHQKILEENKIRESLKKAQKEERVKSVNAYINAYGSIVGNAAGVGAFTGVGMPGIDPNMPIPQGPTFASAVGNLSGGVQSPIPAQPQPAIAMPNIPVGGSHGASVAGGVINSSATGGAGVIGGGSAGSGFISGGSGTGSFGGGAGSFGGSGNGGSGVVSTGGGNAGGYSQGVSGGGVINAGSGTNGGNFGGNASGGSSGMGSGGSVAGSSQGGYSAGAGSVNMGGNPMGGVSMPNIPIGNAFQSLVGGMMSATPYIPPVNNQPHMNVDYQNFDYISESVEPCVIPFIVGYENKGVTTYGNMLEDYATFDRYKFLITTNNNALYTYIENKRSQVQSPEQIISDLHIRYAKNAMAKSGLATPDSNLANFDYKGDLRKFFTKFVPQNMIDIVISDYTDLVNSINFDMLKDVIEHRFMGDLESYVPEKMKNDIVKCGNMIATVAKAIMSESQVRKTYEEYSNKMKQTYINSLIGKIESGDIPTLKLDTESIYSRILDYLSFSIKGHNVIIQNEDAKDSGLNTYPRSAFFKQKENADMKLRSNKVLTFEQNEIVTTRNNPNLEGLNSNVTNLYGTLYKFNGGYNKLLLKLKPYSLASGVKFMENLVDALKSKIDIKAEVIVEEETKPVVPLVKFASKEKAKTIDDADIIYDYDDERWYVRKGFVLDKEQIKEYSLLLAFGRKYALDREKTQLKEDFYNNNILSLPKINEYFKDVSDETRNLMTSVIREVMMNNFERFIDFVDHIDKKVSLHVNKMLYINRMIMESNSFDKKNRDEKKETIETLETNFNKCADDLVNPHPEIYSSIDDIDHYMKLYRYYALSDLFETYSEDKRLITSELEEYFEVKKKEFRSNLLEMIRDKVYMNGYEQEMAAYFELNMEKIVTLDDKPEIEAEQEQEEVKEKVRVKIKNIDVIFKGIHEGFEKSVKNENNQTIVDEIEEFRRVFDLIGTLPSIDSDEKELEIALPNNQTIICNIKGFIQQYLFRYIIDKEHELGPFAYVVKELEQHEELGPVVQGIESIAERLNSPELGINLIAKFSSITLSNNGNIFKIGDNISTVVETINRLKTPTDMQKALNRDVFYKEGVNGVAKAFDEYFNRRKLENMK